MSTKKEKYLESAQKFIMKGQIDRAIKDYEQLIALDSNDMRHRQRLAELLVRVNRKEDAIAEYEAIGKHYADNAYYLKAIAVNKQIQKLMPDELNTSITLALLNEKQGLIGNAIAEYGLVCRAYERAANWKELVGVLEKMLTIDPENPATQLKLAEAHYMVGELDKAYEEFTRIALLSQERGDEPAFDRICERIQQLFSDKGEFIMDFLSAQIEKGDMAEAIPCLQGIISKDSANLKAWRLLIQAYRSRRETENLKLAYRHMFRIFPDDATVWEGMIRCALDEGDVDEAVELLQLHVPRFVACGDHESPELLYLAALELAPDDTVALEGLANLYEATGASAKLSAIRARLEAVSLAQKSHAKPSKALTDISPNPVTPLVDSFVQPNQTVDWEDEIDLSILQATELHELPVEADDHATLSDVIPANSPDEAYSEEIPVDQEVPATPTAEEGAIPAEDAACQVELEFSDDFSGADWLNEMPETPAFGAGPIEEGTLTDVGEPTMPDVVCTVPVVDEFFNLGEELLADGFGEESQASLPQDKYGLDGLFTEFKKGLDQQVDEGDTETHYNLGIAYMEMGLLDDAISEFQVAAVDPCRKTDCLTLQGVCYRDKGDIEMAEQVFQAGINMEGVAPEGLLSLKYELALLHETAGRKDEALRTYLDVQSVRPGFRDTQQKLAELRGEEYTGELEELELLEEELEGGES